MDKIQLKRDSEPIDLTENLLMAAYNDAREDITKGAVKATLTMGITTIAQKERFVSLIISDKLEDTTPISTHIMHLKNRIKCDANMADKQKVLNILNQYLDEQ